MKFYNSIGPNPRVVRMFAAERGVALTMEEVDIVAADNRKEPHLARHPMGQVPAMQLDDGSYIVSVCRSTPLLALLPRAICRHGTCAEG